MRSSDVPPNIYTKPFMIKMTPPPQSPPPSPPYQQETIPPQRTFRWFSESKVESDQKLEKNSVVTKCTKNVGDEIDMYLIEK